VYPSCGVPAPLISGKLASNPRVRLRESRRASSQPFQNSWWRPPSCIQSTYPPSTNEPDGASSVRARRDAERSRQAASACARGGARGLPVWSLVGVRCLVSRRRAPPTFGRGVPPYARGTHGCCRGRGPGEVRSHGADQVRCPDLVPRGRNSGSARLVQKKRGALRAHGEARNPVPRSSLCFN